MTNKTVARRTPVVVFNNQESCLVSVRIWGDGYLTSRSTKHDIRKGRIKSFLKNTEKKNNNRTASKTNAAAMQTVCYCSSDKFVEYFFLYLLLHKLHAVMACSLILEKYLTINLDYSDHKYLPTSGRDDVTLVS